MFQEKWIWIGKVKFIELKNESEWIREIIKKEKREELDTKTIFKEYDIKFKTKELEEKYIKMLV